MLLWLALLAIAASLLTTFLIVVEIHWSIQNLLRLWNSRTGIISRIVAIPLTPLCFLPVIWDVLATLGLTTLFGLGGMVGIFSGMMASSVVASYLFIQRRARKWRFA